MSPRTLLAAAALALLLAAPAAAQDAWEPPAGEATRAALEARRAEAVRAAADPGAPEEARVHAANTAELLRVRLRDGDFQTGDQVMLEVEGEQALSGTFGVAAGPVLPLPVVGEMPLRGVLRSELPERVRAHVARFVRDPVVRTRTLVRVAVLGQVRSPGFYAVPAGSMVSDAVMAAGGPLPTSRMAAMRIDRGATRVWAGRPLQEAVQHGFSLDEMGVRSGDQILVPADPGSRSATALRVVTVVPGALLAVIGIARLF